jgi:hypothetical protein
MSDIDGDIIFKTPSEEILRLKGDGSILIRGKVITNDSSLIDGFKEFLGMCNITGATRGGNLTVVSGKGFSNTAKGGDVSFIGPSCQCPNLLAGHLSKCYLGKKQ